MKQLGAREMSLKSPPFPVIDKMLLKSMLVLIINDLTFTNGYNLIVAYQHFGQPVAVPVMIEIVVCLFQMMDFVLIDGFELFAFLAVLVVGVFTTPC